MLTRRMMMAAGACAAFPANAAENPFAALEAKHGGRLGVAVKDTGTGKTLSWRAGERFAMCSTFKLMLAAAVLQRIGRGEENADRVITFSREALVSWSPETEKHLGEGMRVSALLDAILLVSDNTAANLLLDTIGGPAGWTRYARSIGDTTSRLDRTETALNSAEPGDERDTTTPAAMLANLATLFTGKRLLSDTDYAYFTLVMGESKTGIRRLKAGLPPGWGIAGKTGSGGNGTRNEIGLIFPAGAPPILVCAYYTGSNEDDAAKEAVLAEVGRIIAAM